MKLFGILAHEVRHEQWNFCFPLPQRRQSQTHSTNAVIQIFAKPPRLDLDFQIAGAAANKSRGRPAGKTAARSLQQRIPEASLGTGTQLSEFFQKNCSRLYRGCSLVELSDAQI